MKKFSIGIFTLTSAVAIILLILSAEVIRQAVADAILICGNSIIPSLFPICFIVTLLINSGALSSVNTRLVPYILFAVSQVAGYPVGAKVLNLSVKEGLLNKIQSEKVLPSMICAGPAFIISIVGEQIFKSSDIGIRLYISQIVANFIIFLFLSGRKLRANKITAEFHLSSAFTDSVISAAISTLIICIYVILFFVAAATVKNYLGISLSQWFSYIFEITSAVFQSDNIYVTCCVLAWSGICVMMQVMGISSDIKPSFFNIVKCRIVAALISCTLLKLTFIIAPLSQDVLSNINTKPTLTYGGNIGFIIVFILSIFVLLITIKSKATGKLIDDVL